MKHKKVCPELSDKEYRESIATQMRVIREQRELTQEQLAAVIGSTKSAISRMENINNAVRDVETLEAMVFALLQKLSKITFN